MSDQLVDTQQQQPEPPVPVEIPQDDAPQVHIDGEDKRIQDAVSDTHPEPDDEPQQQQLKKPRRAHNRVNNALNRAIAAESHAAELQRELDLAKAQAAELAKRNSQAEFGTFNAIEAQKKSELEKAKADYANARGANDVNAEADALERISSARAALNDVEAWKATRPAEPEAPQPPQRPQAPQPQNLPPPPPDPTTNAYLQENRWFLPYSYDENGNALVDRATGKLVANPEYSGDMHDEAVLLHKKLDREYRAGRFQHPPGSQGYFEHISDHMRQEFPDYFGEDDEPQQPVPRTPPMQQTRQPVAPANRSGMPGQNNGKPKSDKPTLTRDQAEFALSLRNAKSPGYIYPRGHAKAGQPMSDQDALYKHWQEVKKDEPNTVTR